MDRGISLNFSGSVKRSSGRLAEFQKALEAIKSEHLSKYLKHSGSKNYLLSDYSATRHTRSQQRPSDCFVQKREFSGWRLSPLLLNSGQVRIAFDDRQGEKKIKPYHEKKIKVEKKNILL